MVFPCTICEPSVHQLRRVIPRAHACKNVHLQSLIHPGGLWSPWLYFDPCCSARVIHPIPSHFSSLQQGRRTISTANCHQFDSCFISPVVLLHMSISYCGCSLFWGQNRVLFPLSKTNPASLPIVSHSRCILFFLLYMHLNTHLSWADYNWPSGPRSVGWPWPDF